MCLPFPPYQLGSLFAKTNTLQILTLLIFVCPHDVAIIGACFNSCILPNATGMAGLEPTTLRLTGACSTIELQTKIYTNLNWCVGRGGIEPPVFLRWGFTVPCPRR